MDGACATPSAACVTQREMELEAAKKALADLEAMPEEATLGMITAAEMAVEEAMTALMDAKMALATYKAMQPPTYTTEALETAVATAACSPT